MTKQVKIIIASVTACVLVGGTMLGLWLGGVFDGNKMPAWLKTAVTDFKNAKAVPELEEILPGAVWNDGTNAANPQSASFKSMSSSVALTSFEPSDYLSIAPNELAATYAGDIDSIIDTFSVVSLSFTAENLINSMVKDITQKNVWQNVNTTINYGNGLKSVKMWIRMDENEAGDRTLYNLENDGTNPRLLTLYANGAYESYRDTPAPSQNGDRMVQYSYNDANKFVYIQYNTNTDGSLFSYSHMEFNFDGEDKSGVKLFCHGDTVMSSVFEGNDESMWLYSYQRTSAETSTTATLINNGLAMSILEYQGSFYLEIDVKAFVGLEAIYYEKESVELPPLLNGYTPSELFRVHGFKFNGEDIYWETVSGNFGVDMKERIEATRFEEQREGGKVTWWGMQGTGDPCAVLRFSDTGTLPENLAQYLLNQIMIDETHCAFELNTDFDYENHLDLPTFFDTYRIENIGDVSLSLSTLSQFNTAAKSFFTTVSQFPELPS